MIAIKNSIIIIIITYKTVSTIWQSLWKFADTVHKKFADTLSVTSIVSSTTNFELIARLFKYLPFSQIHVLGIQL